MVQTNPKQWKATTVTMLKQHTYCTTLAVIAKVATTRKLSPSGAVHLEAEALLKSTEFKVDVSKFCANTRSKIIARMQQLHVQLQRVPEHLRNNVGDLPAFGAVSREDLISSCIFSEYYVLAYVRALSGEGTSAADITVAGLAFLWLSLHKVAGDKVETSYKRYQKTLEWINEALTDDDVRNLGTFVHGTSDVLAEPQSPEDDESSSHSTSSEDDGQQNGDEEPMRAPIRSLADRLALRAGTPAATWT